MPQRVTRADQINRVLTAIYQRYLEKIRKDKNYPWDIYTLQTLYGEQIYAATRAAATEVYNEGIKYVGNKKNVDVYPTQTNVDEIKIITDNAIGSFWGRIKEDAMRSKQQEVQDPELPNKDTPAFMHGIAGVVATSGLALATITKTVEVIDEIAGKPQLRWVTQRDERTCPLCSQLDGTTYDADDPSIPVPGQNGPGGTHTNCRCYLEMVE